MKMINLFIKIAKRMKQEMATLVWLLVGGILILYGLREHVNLFIDSGTLSRQSSRYEGKQLRLGGVVQKNSIKRADDWIEFQAGSMTEADIHSSIRVVFQGMLPSLFKEGKAMVAEGIYREGVFYAQTLLAKHDENYAIPLRKERAYAG